MYITTVIEIIIFLALGFFLSDNVLRRIYEGFDIEYMGNIWTVWFGLSFILFCLFTLFRRFILSNNSLLLEERITSITFWIIFILSIYGVFSPFVTGEIFKSDQLKAFNDRISILLTSRMNVRSEGIIHIFKES